MKWKDEMEQRIDRLEERWNARDRGITTRNMRAAGIATVGLRSFRHVSAEERMIRKLEKRVAALEGHKETERLRADAALAEPQAKPADDGWVDSGQSAKNTLPGLAVFSCPQCGAPRASWFDRLDGYACPECNLSVRLKRYPQRIAVMVRAEDLDPTWKDGDVPTWLCGGTTHFVCPRCGLSRAILADRADWPCSFCGLPTRAFWRDGKIVVQFKQPRLRLP